MDGDKIVGWFLGVAIAGLVVTGFRAIYADHSVNHYYLMGGDAGAVCIKAQRDWTDDFNAYCTNDVDKAVEIIGKLNATLTGSQSEED